MNTTLKTHCARVGFSAFVVLTAAAKVLAETGAEPAHGGDHHPHVANWFGLQNTHAPALGWVMVTFGVFMLALWKLTKKPLHNALNARADSIENAIKEAQNAKAEAVAKKKEADAKLASLDDEMKSLRADFQTRGEAEKVRLKKAGEAAAARITKDAEDTITAELDRAKRDLKHETAALAVKLAEERIMGALSDADEKALQERFLEQLSA